MTGAAKVAFLTRQQFWPVLKIDFGRLDVGFILTVGAFNFAITKNPFWIF